MRGSAVENPTNQSFRNPSLIQVMSCKGSVSYFCVILEISANANDVSATPGINELMLYSSDCSWCFTISKNNYIIQYNSGV